MKLSLAGQTGVQDAQHVQVQVFYPWAQQAIALACINAPWKSNCYAHPRAI